MALDFGKLNFSISLNPTSAFPIDARSYFESLTAATAAAASAKPAGSAESVYYYGQQIVVVENTKAKFYIIQPDNTLSEVGGVVDIDPNVFEYVNNKLDLFGFSAAVAGAQLVKGADGKISWIKPDTTTVDGLATAVESLREDLNTLTENVYTKTEVDTKIASAGHLSRKIIQSLEEIDVNAADAEKYIYMLPSELEGDNKYYEYIVIGGAIEPVGSWAVDLSDYATIEDVNKALEEKVNKIDGHRLLTPTEATLLETLQENAEPNFIKSVDQAQFSVSEAGHLELLAIAQEKVTGLTQALEQLVAKEEGKGLSTNDFTNELKEKLDNIDTQKLVSFEQDIASLDRVINGVTNEDGEVVEKGLTDHIADHATAIGDLNETTNELVDLVNGLKTTQEELVETVQTLGTTVDEHATAIEELQSSVESFATTYVSLANFNKVVGNMDALLTREASIIDQIDDIYERLEWGELV